MFTPSQTWELWGLPGPLKTVQPREACAHSYPAPNSSKLEVTQISVHTVNVLCHIHQDPPHEVKKWQLPKVVLRAQSWGEKTSNILFNLSLTPRAFSRNHLTQHRSFTSRLLTPKGFLSEAHPHFLKCSPDKRPYAHTICGGSWSLGTPGVDLQNRL